MLALLLVLALLATGEGKGDGAWDQIERRSDEVPLDDKQRPTLVWPLHNRYNRLDVVRFGVASRVALDTTLSADYSPLPHALWVHSQVSQVLNSSCPDCTWTEIGGPGLCAFRFSAVPRNSTRRPRPASWVPSATPWHQMLAAMTVDINGDLANVTVYNHTAAPQQGAPDEVLMEGHSKHILLVDFCAGCRPRVDLALKLLAARRVFAMVLMVAPSSGTGGGSSTEQQEQHEQLYDYSQDVAALFKAAAGQGMTGYRGGFDGAAAHASAEGARALVTAAASSPVPLAVFFSQQRLLPRPKLHVFMPLKGPNKYIEAKLPAYCGNLLDTASHVNLSGLHLMGPTVKERLYRKPMVAGKLHLFLRLLRRDANASAPAISPSDVLVVIDATDTLAQVSTEGLLEHFMQAGAPLFEISTETSCWPRELYPLCHMYDRVPGSQSYATWPNRYINGGAYIGRAVMVHKYVHDVVETLSKRLINETWYPQSCAESRNDQGLLACPYLFGNRYGMTLDYASTFFFSLNRNHVRLQLSDMQWHYNVSGATPAILHGNSRGGKEQLPNMRAAILPAGYRGLQASPGYNLLVDGHRVRYDELCAAAFQPPPPPPRTTRVQGIKRAREQQAGSGRGGAGGPGEVKGRMGGAVRVKRAGQGKRGIRGAGGQRGD